MIITQRYECSPSIMSRRGRVFCMTLDYDLDNDHLCCEFIMIYVNEIYRRIPLFLDIINCF